MDKPVTTLTSQILNATVVVTALGYLVDIYDLLLFSITRTPSLMDLGLSGDGLTKAGLFISNCQYAGLILGGYLCGVLGDKFGRKSVLFGSILLYSLGSLYCSTVESVDHYALGRFVTGFGVAAELGVGLTLITEILASHRRGYGVAFFIILGFCGVFAAAAVTELLSWREAYLVGGVAGLGLLFARGLVRESSLYQQTMERKIKRGGLSVIFRNRRLLKKYIAGILVVTPVPFVVQIVWTLSPELAKAQGLATPVKASVILSLGYACVILGDMLACGLSETLRSRKRAMLVSLSLGFVFFLKYLFVPSTSAAEFYLANGCLGFAFGVLVVGGTLSAEQVGTDIRSTVATTTPNFARGLVIPMNLLFGYLKPMTGSLTAVGIIGSIILTAALWGWWNVDETYGKDINYEEA